MKKSGVLVLFMGLINVSVGQEDQPSPPPQKAPLKSILKTYPSAQRTQNRMTFAEGTNTEDKQTIEKELKQKTRNRKIAELGQEGYNKLLDEQYQKGRQEIDAFAKRYQSELQYLLNIFKMYMKPTTQPKRITRFFDRNYNKKLEAYNNQVLNFKMKRLEIAKGFMEQYNNRVDDPNEDLNKGHSSQLPIVNETEAYDILSRLAQNNLSIVVDAKTAPIVVCDSNGKQLTPVKLMEEEDISPEEHSRRKVEKKELIKERVRIANQKQLRIDNPRRYFQEQGITFNAGRQHLRFPIL